MEITVKELAKVIGAEVVGNAGAVIRDFAKIEEAGEGAITFLANPKYTHYIYSTGATAVLVRRDFEPERPVATTLLKVDDPYATLADLLNYVQSLRPRRRGVEQPVFIGESTEVPEDAYVGAFAYIGRGVKIGRDVQIFPQSYIGDGVEIGDGTVIRAGVRIYEGCKIGSRCVIHSGAVIGADGFGFAPRPDGYEKIPQTGIVVLEDEVEIGANTTVDRATFGATRVGRGTKLDNLIQVAHNVTIGRNNVFAAQTGIAGSTQIGDWNSVGGQCGFAGHITVGSRNQFGAQSGIPNSVGDGRRLIGYPAIDARQFAKNQVYIKRLETLFNKKQ